MPWFNIQVWVIDRIKSDGNIGGDLNDSSEIKDPAEETNPTREESNNPTPFRAWREGRPVVDTAS